MGISLNLTFSDSSGHSKECFRWVPHCTKLSEKWINSLIFHLENPYTIREQKFFGWDDSPSRQIQILNSLRESISIINEEFEGIYNIPDIQTASRDQFFDQDCLNSLHVHFEKLMGKSWDKSPYLAGISVRGINAIRNLNEQIHFYEDFKRTKEKFEKEKEYFGGFQFQIYPYDNRELNTEDLNTFTLEQDLGDIVTSYCQLGKHWLEVYSDRDFLVGFDNISPLRYFGPSGYCQFYKKNFTDAKKEKKQILEFIREYHDKRKVVFDGDLPKLAIGHSRLACLEKSSALYRWNSTERAAFFLHHDSIQSIEIKVGAQSWKKDFLERNSQFVESDFPPEAFFSPLSSLLNASRFDQFSLSR
jgi:hypothetical protein